MKRKLPKLTNDKAAADFVATADLTTYDLSTLKPVPTVRPGDRQRIKPAAKQGQS